MLYCILYIPFNTDGAFTAVQAASFQSLQRCRLLTSVRGDLCNTRRKHIKVQKFKMDQKVTLGESQELFLFGAYHKYREIKGMHIFSVTVEWVETSVRGIAVNLKNNLKKRSCLYVAPSFCITDL